MHQNQSDDLLFASAQASVRAITRWAARFGSVMTSQPGKGTDGTETWYRTDFGYYGLDRHGLRHIPAAPASN